MTEGALTGRCLCGAVRYESRGEVRLRVHCHCESCRRATSSPFTTFLIVDRAGLRWTATPPQAYASSPGVTRHFCPRCGSPMGYETERRPGDFDLYAASLDDHSGFHPDLHSHWAEHVPWVELADQLPRR